MKTPVIIRRFKVGCELIALFPTLPGTCDPSTCLSYMRLGQHGSASVGLVSDTVGVKPYEIEGSTAVKSLLAELAVAGYDLQLVTRFTCKHSRTRIDALKGVSA